MGYSTDPGTRIGNVHLKAPISTAPSRSIAT